MLINPSIYDLLEMNRSNPFSILTSLLIHDLDNSAHLSVNLGALWIFGYIVNIQTNRFRMLITFFVCGVLANISTVIFSDLINHLFSTTFTNWAVSSRHWIGENLRVVPSPNGGGASDGLMGLGGFALALAIDFLIINLHEAYRISRNSTNKYLIILIDRLNQSIVDTCVNCVGILGILVLWAGLIMDLEMFYYVLTFNYAAANGELLSYPTSDGHPLLAHAFGGLIGFIIGIYYTRFFQKGIRNSN